MRVPVAGRPTLLLLSSSSFDPQLLSVAQNTLGNIIGILTILQIGQVFRRSPRGRASSYTSLLLADCRNVFAFAERRKQRPGGRLEETGPPNVSFSGVLFLVPPLSPCRLRIFSKIKLEVTLLVIANFYTFFFLLRRLLFLMLCVLLCSSCFIPLI